VYSLDYQEVRPTHFFNYKQVNWQGSLWNSLQMCSQANKTSQSC